MTPGGRGSPSEVMHWHAAAAIGLCACTDTGRSVDPPAIDAGSPPDCATAEQLEAIGGTFLYEGGPVEGPDAELSFEIWVKGAPDWTTRLVAGGPGFDGHPAWSPDGSRLVYQSNVDGNGDLFIVDPDGTNERAIATGEKEQGYPVWLPEGIVYRSDGNEHWRLDPETGEETRSDIPDAENWTLSPDGSQIVITSGDPAHLVLAERDGTVIDRLADACPVDVHPNWEPNGSRILYSCGDGTRDGEWEVRIIDVETREVTEITDNPGPDWAAGWAGDGEWVVVNSSIDDNWDVYVMRADGSDRMRVSCHEGAARYASWIAAEPLR